MFQSRDGAIMPLKVMEAQLWLMYGLPYLVCVTVSVTVRLKRLTICPSVRPSAERVRVGGVTSRTNEAVAGIAAVPAASVTLAVSVTVPSERLERSGLATQVPAAQVAKATSGCPPPEEDAVRVTVELSIEVPGSVQVPLIPEADKAPTFVLLTVAGRVAIVTFGVLTR